MKKFLPVVALTALAFSGPVLAQTTMTLSDGTVIESPVVVSPSNIVIAQAAMPAYAASVYVQPEMVMTGYSTGRIKVGAPKYDSQGRITFKVRPIGRP